jgi:hypothetical protein
VTSSQPPDTTIALGDPVAFDIAWSCQGSNCPDPAVTATCDGMSCTVERDGSTVRVMPAATGTTSITLALDDELFGGGTRATFGPYTIVAIDRDELRCTTRVPGTAAWRPCSDGVAAGDDVRVEGWTVAGERRIDAVGASVVVNDGFLNGGWTCSPASLATGAGGMTPACVAHGIYAGTYRVVLDRDGPRAELSLHVTEAAAPAP